MRTYFGRQNQYDEARVLRSQGYGYRTIGAKIDVPWSTVRAWVKDIPSDAQVAYRKAMDLGQIPFEKLRKKYSIRNRLKKERGHKCEWCDLEEWRDKPIWLEMHRIGGSNSSYTDRDNVLLLCLNCHSTTNGYRNTGMVER